MHVRDARQRRQQPKHQGRGDVVGEVAGYSKRSRRRSDASEVELERIRLVDHQVGVVRCPGTEPGRKVTVDLDDVELAARGEQREGECAATGSDLHDQLVGLRFDRIDDAPDHVPVVKEVLSESLAGVCLASRPRRPAGSGAAHDPG